MGKSALVLLRLPIQLERTNGLELGQERPEDLQVDVVTEVDPDQHEQDEVGSNKGMVDVVERLGGREEEVADVVGDIDGETDVGEVEAVAKSNEGQTDDVVADQLLEVLAGLLHAEDEDDGLLGPVGGLEEVVELDEGLVRLVWEALVHAGGVEVPDRGAAHDIHAKGAEDAEVDGRVQLLHEARLLGLAQTSATGKRLEHLLHDEFTGEREHDGVEGDESDIPFALAVLDRHARIVLGELVGEEDEAMDRIRLGRVHEIAGEEGSEDDGGEDERAPDAELAEAREEAAGPTALGETLSAIMMMMEL